MKIAFTGHRPDKIGGALGVDTDAASIAYNLRIPYSVIPPCENQESKWSEHHQNVYKTMCKLASEYTPSTVPYSPKAMQDRNIRMVDECDILIAVWDGSPGGTANCVKYARSINKQIIYIDPRDL